MKNNYPIKYALIPMIEQVGWVSGLNELERDYGVVCYIVSKCYLIDEVKKYHQDGSEDISYNVVCPYQRYDSYDIYNIEEPSFNFMSGYCTNATKVKEIFNSLEEAKKAKKRKNDEILARELCFLSYENYQAKEKEIKNNFNRKLNYYNKLEELIEKQTPYLNVNMEPKKQAIIVNDDDGVNEINTSFYQYIYLLRYKNYLVYSVDEDNYNYILNKENKIFKYNPVLLLVNDKESNTTKIIGDNQELYLNDQRICDSCDNFNTPNSYDCIIYTKETFQDILDAYHYNEKVIKLGR